MPDVSYPTLTIIGTLTAGVVSIATIAIKALTVRRRNGASSGQSSTCVYHKGCEADIKSRVENIACNERHTRSDQRLDNIERALTGADGLQVMVGKLVTQLEISANISEAFKILANKLGTNS